MWYRGESGAPAGIRTRVLGSRVPDAGPDYTRPCVLPSTRLPEPICSSPERMCSAYSANKAFRPW